MKTWQLVGALILTFAIGLAIGLPGGEKGGAGHEGHEDHEDSSSAEAEVWTCSMHPQIKMPEPGQCPICGMDLIPLKKDADGDAPTADQVVLSKRARALAKIETVKVKRSDTSVELHLLGRLSYDETKVRTITPWTDGRIDQLYVSAEGEKIKRGQMVASIYSPEIYAAQVDLMQAKEQIERLSDALPMAKRGAEAALGASRTRLRLLGVAPGEVEKMAKGTTPTRNVAVTAHYAGVVVEQMVHEGAYVKAGTPMFRTAELDTIWAQLDAYEEDLSRIQTGQKVTLLISTFPGERFEGAIAFVDPIVNAGTRTTRIRVEVDNQDGRLLPGMFADAIVHAPSTNEADLAPLVVPRTAPLFTGKRSVVYVELPDRDRPTYEAVVVRLGPLAGDVYPVLEGLKEGDRVVRAGAFVLDSELQIRGGNSMMSRDDDLARAARSPVRVNDAFRVGFARVVGPYLDASNALGDDKLDAAKEALSALSKQAAGFDPRSPQQARDVYLPMGERISAQARRAAGLGDLDAVRRVFADISDLMTTALHRFGNPLEAEITVAHCPMALDNKGATWAQLPSELKNPYFGSTMIGCGDVEHRLSPHAEAAGEPTAAPSKSVPAKKAPSPKKAAAPAPTAAPPESPTAAPSHAPVYTCPMHPQIKQPTPGKCPICKMVLVPEAHHEH